MLIDRVFSYSPDYDYDSPPDQTINPEIVSIKSFPEMVFVSSDRSYQADVCSSVHFYHWLGFISSVTLRRGAAVTGA